MFKKSTAATEAPTAAMNSSPKAATMSSFDVPDVGATIDCGAAVDCGPICPAPAIPAPTCVPEPWRCCGSAIDTRETWLERTPLPLPPPALSSGSSPVEPFETIVPSRGRTSLLLRTCESSPPPPPPPPDATRPAPSTCSWIWRLIASRTSTNIAPTCSPISSVRTTRPVAVRYASIASRIASADAKRRFGSFSSAHSTIESSVAPTSWRMDDAAGMGAVSRRWIVDAAESPVIRRRCVSISQSTMPMAKTSERASIGAPVACSGDM